MALVYPLENSNSFFIVLAGLALSYRSHVRAFGSVQR